MKRYYLYRFLDENSEVLYVGKTTDLTTRMKTHLSLKGHLKSECIEKTEKIEYMELKSEFNMVVKEIYYISKLKPIYNQRHIYDTEGATLAVTSRNDKWQIYDANEFSESNAINNEYESAVLRKIKMLLIAKGIKMDDLAKGLSIPKKALIEKLKYGLMKTDELAAIANFLGVGVSVNFVLNDGRKI